VQRRSIGEPDRVSSTQLGSPIAQADIFRHVISGNDNSLRNLNRLLTKTIYRPFFLRT
jgi:hypothetical protein